MKHYKSYMHRVTVSDELHQRLLDLREDKTSRRPVWLKYAAAAACAALLAGVGIWGTAGQGRDWRELVTSLPSATPAINSSAPVESQGAVESIDLAPKDPNGAEPGMKTIEGYEIYVNQFGLVEYRVLPWIDYGSANEDASAKLDWSILKGAAKRDLNAEEITAFLGGPDGVNLHLDWSAYELTGWAAWYEDGSFWGAYLGGYKGPMDHFEFAVTAGSLPPTCIAFDGSVKQEIWGVTVTADKFDGKEGCSRRVSFMKGNYGYRFDLTSTEGAQAAEKLVSRAVTYVIVGNGLDFQAAIRDSSEPAQASPAPAGSEPEDNQSGASSSRPPVTVEESAPSLNPAEIIEPSYSPHG